MQEDIVKITGAVYRLLEYLPESDPLKNKAKEKALAILENQKAEDIRILQDYLQLAVTQGWISSMNVIIIKKQYSEILNSKPKTLNKPQSLNTKTLTARQKQILQLLDQQEKVQVGDIIKKIPQVTKRTVRRDMDELLRDGTVVRTGRFNQVFYQRG